MKATEILMPILPYGYIYALRAIGIIILGIVIFKLVRKIKYR